MRGCPRDWGVPCLAVLRQWSLLCSGSHLGLQIGNCPKTDLGRTFRQHIRALLTGRTSWRKNVLARKFRLVLGTGPGVGRWNKIGCCRWCSTQEARRWQGWLCLLSFRSFRKQPRRAKCASRDPRVLVSKACRILGNTENRNQVGRKSWGTSWSAGMAHQAFPLLVTD